MGCGASTSNPQLKYASKDAAPIAQAGVRDPAQSEAKKQYLEAVKRRGSQKYDAVLSFETSYSPNLYEVVSTELKKSYIVGDRMLSSISEASRLIIFLSPSYFSDAMCCAEFCEAVKVL